MEGERLARLAQLVVERLAAIAGRDIPRLAVLPGSLPTDSATFEQLVTGLYIWFREAAKSDMDFLMSQVVVDDMSALRSFLRDVRALRHSQQHSPDDQILRDADKWFSQACNRKRPTSSDEWRGCSSHLLGQAERAAECMIALVAKAKGEPLVVEQWKRFGAAKEMDLPTALGSALGLVGRRPRPNDLDFLTMRLDEGWDYYSRTAGRSRDRVEALEATASLVVLRWALTPLPVSPTELVDAVGGDQASAMAIQLLGHAVQEYFGDDAIVPIVRRVWAEALISASSEMDD